MRTQAGHNNRKVFLFVSLWMFLSGAAALAQEKPAAVEDLNAIGTAFEVAVVRPAKTDHAGGFGIRMTPSGRFTASAVSLNFLIWQAYREGPSKYAVTLDRTAPKWVDSDEFDINAKVDNAYLQGWDKLSDEQRLNLVRPMLRRLLADRFQLKVRIEMRKTPVYALVQAKGGAHVQEVSPPVLADGDQGEAMAKWMQDNLGKGVPGFVSCSDKCIANAVKISDAIGQIAASSGAERIVIDETGLRGYYNFSFTQPHDRDEPAMQEVEDDLGMKFEPRSVPMKTYVIESAIKPSVDGTP
jgi:uncharacterized protein (TIGR03435 family)